MVGLMGKPVRFSIRNYVNIPLPCWSYLWKKKWGGVRRRKRKRKEKRQKQKQTKAVLVQWT